MVLELSTFVPRGEESGVTLALYLCPGLSGVVGVGAVERNPPNIDVRWRRLFCEEGGGSDDGVRERLFLLIVKGVTVLPVILRANFLKGEIEREMVLAALPAREDLEPLGGVLRYPFREDVVTDTLDPFSL